MCPRRFHTLPKGIKGWLTRLYLGRAHTRLNASPTRGNRSLFADAIVMHLLQWTAKLTLMSGFAELAKRTHQFRKCLKQAAHARYFPYVAHVA
jgi:hypothetical protein